MASSRAGTPRRPRHAYRRLALWAGLSIGWILPSTGCQVEYAGMTLPSGKYMHDDVQYFAPGPDFPWANTQAATQRARMQAMGLVAPPGEGGMGVIPPAAGAIPPIQNRMGRPTDINASPLGVEPAMPGQPMPAEPVGVVPGPGGIPAPNAFPGQDAAPPGPQ